MRNIKNYFMSGGIIFVLTCCSQQESISDTRKVEITQEIKEIIDGYANAVKRHDTDWLLNFWSNEKNFVIAGDGELIADYESGIAKPTRDFISNLREVFHFEFSKGHAFVINENAVSYTTSFDWGIVLLSGDTIKSKGAWLYLFTKSEKNWKVVQSAGTHTYYK
ncbi:MAG: hypothetical protein A2X03_12985 [Bacteroidetes bacterium GWA2_40_15]|nr:MAG: hypothetical protein A2X03_12985 [Bacteroidetes bacterium GWA2_40_15]